LLDTWPELTVASQLPAAELLRVDTQTGAAEALQLAQSIRSSPAGCCILHRLAALPLSYLETMPATDFRKLAVRCDAAGWRTEWHLFGDFLEKGVIRRARLHTAFLPRENDVARALEACAAIEQRALPLTT
jgi:hypothetical protein